MTFANLVHWLRPLWVPNVGHLSVVAAIGLAVVGLVAIETTQPRRPAVATEPAAVSQPDGPRLGTMTVKQAVFLAGALGVMAVAALPHHRRLVPFSYPLFVVTLVLLAVLLVPGMPRWLVPVRNGARRWFDLQVILFQPSELAKLGFVLALACYLRFRENYRRLGGLLRPLVLTFIPMGLIVLEPDLGTAMVFLPVFFAMMVAAGARLKHILLILLIGVLMMPAMYPLLRPHQKQRIVAMVSQLRGQTTHRSDIGFQGHKARTLVGAGGLSGHSAGHAGDLIRFNRLPEAHNDMIFAVICTRWGLLGGLVVVGLYLLFFTGALLAAALNRDPFARLVAVGITAIIFAQMCVNIGMTVGLLPITGMTLPMVSYGGSSLLASFLMVGLVLNVGAHRPIVMSNPAFEFDNRMDRPIRRAPAIRR